MISQKLGSIRETVDLNSKNTQTYNIATPGAHIFMTINGHEEYLGHNLIPDSAAKLMAWLALNSNAPNPGNNGGFTYIAVGTGDPVWDILNPPAPTKDQTVLENELERTLITTATFIDSEGQPTGTPTNVVDFIATFGTGEAVGPWTEVGLFGGDASATVDSGLLVSVLNFPVKSKLTNETISWRFRYTFVGQ
mgnify:CR=1 FL=1